jgi:undecaprenyl-diphosphatase
MSGKYLTFVIALSTALIALGLLPGARTPALMVDIQAFTMFFDDDLWKSLNVFGHFLGAASILLLITRKMLIVWALVLSALLGGCISRVLKLTLDVPRPAALMHEDLFIIGEKLTHGSMPSGHSMTIAIVFGLFLSLYPRFTPKAQRLGLPLTALVALVCLARVASGAHWPADVFMGAGLGLLIGCISALTVLRWESSLPRHEALNDGFRLLIASALVLVPLPPSCSLEASVALGLSLATWHFLKKNRIARAWSPNLKSTRQY